ncbi:type II 3-dehydroquinate dehydratase [Fulvimarina sp. MAC3]|uniref:type II 3-dehydroquinate dehydratase n=1 Tax=Fulvimarina sp. MAC3 TaxID=3148887 RepID=UPI0031FC4AE5
MKTILVLNGPNLNLLGQRQPELYGRETLADVERICRAVCAEGYDVEMKQSNHEGQLIDWIHEARMTTCGIVINPAAFTHTSIAILDALNTYDPPVIEVHISQIHKREAFRHHSYVSHRSDGVIAGLGTEGYAAAVRRLCQIGWVSPATMEGGFK